MKLPTDQTDGPGTIVGVNVALNGTLKDQNDIIVHGMVDGEVISDKSITIGQSAQVKGPVRGNLVTVAGVVRGSVEAQEKLEILETGKVLGSIDAKDLLVHSGATIVGKITMPSADETVDVEAEIEPEEPSPEDKSENKEEEVLKPEVEEG